MNIKQAIKNWLYSDERLIACNDQDSYRQLNQPPSLNFNLYHANGGMVVEFRTYDQKTDRTNFSTYIVTDEDNIGEKISKIITLELLKY